MIAERVLEIEPASPVTVCLGKDLTLPRLRSKKSRKVIRTLDKSVLQDRGNLFVICRTTLVGDFAPLILESWRKKHLLGLLLLQDVAPTFVDPLLQAAKLTHVRNVLVHGQQGLFEKVSRILNAWETGTPDQLIADATVAGEQLLVRSCDFRLYQVPFDSLKALRKIANESRDKFEISSDGSYIHWTDHDIHLDLDAFRYAIDPVWKARKDRQRLFHDVRFGAAVALLRKECGLTQSGIPELSEREIRRIEKGETQPRSSTLGIIAKAHDMTLDDYLGEVALRVRKSQPTTRLE